MAIKIVFPAGEHSVIVQGLYQWDYGQTLEIECADIGYEIMEVHFACPSMTMAIPRPCTFNNGVGTVPIPDQCLEQGDAITAWICRIDNTQGHTIKSITLPITKRTKPIRTHEVPAELVDKYSELIFEVGETVDALKSGNIIAAKALYADNASRANTAKSAENASYSATAVTANQANYATSAGAINMRLITSCAITAGKGTLGEVLANNTPYLIIYESSGGDIGSGVIICKSTDIYCGCAVNLTYAAYIRGKGVIIASGEQTSAPTAASYAEGTLYVYTFGHIPQ